jgi:Flp pilus assembly protein TadB
MDKEELYEKQSEDPSLRIDRTKFKHDDSLYYEKKPSNISEQSEREQKREMQWKANVEAAGMLKSDRPENEHEQRAEEVEARLRRAEQRQAEEKAADLAKWREDLRQTAEKAKARHTPEGTEHQRVTGAQPPTYQKPASPSSSGAGSSGAGSSGAGSSGAGSSGAGCILPILGIIAFIAILPFLIQLLIIAVPIVIVGGIIFAVIAGLFSKN